MCVCFHIYTYIQTVCMNTHMYICTHILSPEQLISYMKFSLNVNLLFVFLMAYRIRKAIN